MKSKYILLLLTGVILGFLPLAAGAQTVAPTLPVISSFTATPNFLISGQSTILSWSVSGQTALSLDNGIGDVSSLASQIVTPLNTATYDLSAYNSFGTTTASLTINVSSPAAGYGAIISGISLTNITNSSLTVNWTTSMPTDSQVVYGPNTNYASSSALSDIYPLVTSHSISLSGLTAGATYHYSIKSRSGLGQLSQSGDALFGTLNPAFTVPGNPSTSTGGPNLSGVGVSFDASNNPTVFWTTDVPADGQIEFSDSTTTYDLSSAWNAALTTSHAISLTGLSPGLTYHYVIKTGNGSGNITISTDGTFVVPGAAQPTPTPAPTPSPAPAPSLTFVLPGPTPAPQASAPAAIVFPRNVKYGQILKFKDSKAVFLVTKDGLAPFDSYPKYLAYVKSSKQKLKTFAQSYKLFTQTSGTVANDYINN